MQCYLLLMICNYHSSRISLQVFNIRVYKNFNEKLVSILNCSFVVVLYFTMLQLFDTLRSKNVQFQSKVVPVAGDILEPGLGLSDSDVERLSSEVSLVFHSAATVKFDEPLK